MEKPRKRKPELKAHAVPVDPMIALRRKAAASGLLYEGNPRHRDPWQSGRRGTLCPRGISAQQAQELLLDSFAHSGQRYAVRDGQLFAAKEHREGVWHAHPIGWNMAPRRCIFVLQQFRTCEEARLSTILGIMTAPMHKYTSRSFGFGERAVFQCRVEIAPDAHDPYVTPEEAASWGSLELWAGGRNLTGHYEANELLGTVSWYLLPVFEWLAEEWNFLFHEQRPPTAFEGGSGWESLHRTHHPDYFERFGTKAEKVAEENFAWGQRHRLRTAANGGIFPDVVFRRDREAIEVSWGGGVPAGTPDHFFFANGPGVVRLPPREVASVLYNVLHEASATLLAALPESARVRALGQRVGKLRQPQLRDMRLAILAGLGTSVQQWRKRWRHLRSKFVGVLDDWFMGDTDDDLVVTGSCDGALMFGSAAPTLREKDVFALAEKLVEHSQTGMMEDALASRAVSTSPGSIPYEEGYRLAAEWAETSNLWTKKLQPVDIEQQLAHFGVAVSDVILGDQDIGGVAVARNGLAPLILVNTSNPRNAYPSGKRFTLAHELCHLLHDRDHARNVALISGPWAPPGIEQRANAFAARLLMPDALVDAAFVAQSAKAHDPTFDQLLAAAKQLDVSVNALAHHMANRGYFSPAHRDRLLSPHTTEE